MIRFHHVRKAQPTAFARSAVARLGIALVVATTSLGIIALGAPTASATSATQVVTGTDHTCALTSSGGVRCWGGNDFGQLGDGRTITRSLPGAVSGLTSGVQAIAAGNSFSCALLNAGGVQCWGLNKSGQLGDGTGKERHTPVDVSGLTSGVQAIAAGASHACALTTGGGVKCWGLNSDGQLGDGTTKIRRTPVDVTGLTNGVTAVALGAAHSCALLSTGGVQCWGGNTTGQVGDNSTRKRKTPVSVVGLASGVTNIAAGGLHTCARTSAGAAMCWGWNQHGEIGDGTKVDRHVPTAVSGLSSGVNTVIAGDEHSCARTGGTVSCWGDNRAGQLGDGTTDESDVPGPVGGLSGVAGLGAGEVHTCARTNAGAVECWGSNDSGQLGDGTTDDHLTPTGVIGLSGGNDTQAPTVTIVITGPNSGTPDGSAGWFVSGPITGTVSADDTSRGGSAVTAISCGSQKLRSLQGLGTSTASAGLRISKNGVLNISCTATDSEGNTSSAVVKQLKIDKKAPALIVGAPDNVYLHGSASANPTSSDNISGLAGAPTCDPISTASVGLRTVTCTATDVAGNSTTKSAVTTVRYRTVLSQPGNSYTAGDDVPVELALFDDSVAAIPKAEGRSIGTDCRAKVTFSGGGSVLCMAYDDTSRLFSATIATSAGLAPGNYQVRVDVYDPSMALVNSLTKNITIH